MLEEAKLLDDDYDERVEKRSWGTSIEVSGIHYATSLFWQPLQNKDDPFQEVEEASEGVLEGADLFCIKPGKAPQFGICVSHEGYKKGQNVAAVSLATALSDKASFVAVFKVDEGWWYTCIRKGTAAQVNNPAEISRTGETGGVSDGSIPYFNC